MTETYEQVLYELLTSLPVHDDSTFTYDGTIKVRCPFCGDSPKNKKSTHLFVKVMVDEGDVQYYKCMRCSAGGWVDSYLLELLQLYNPDLDELEKERNKKRKSISGKKGFRTNNIARLRLLAPLNNNTTKKKIKYIENRLGITLTTQDILNYRMVLNYYDFFNYNNITEFTRHKNILNALDENYVGFITTNNEFINSRKIIEEYDKYQKRYINYDIFNLNNTSKLYVISNDKVDIMAKAHIILAEGVMDIIGIFNHIYNKEINSNTIYCAVLGSGYEYAIKYFISKGILFADYDIYSDDSISISEYRNLIKKLDYKVLDSNINIHYNTIKKDCGVKKEEISLRSYKLQ